LSSPSFILLYLTDFFLSPDSTTHIPFLQPHQAEQDSQFPSLLPRMPAIPCPPGAEPSSQHTAAHHPHGRAPWAPRSPFQTCLFFPFHSSKAAVIGSHFPCIQSPAILPPAAQTRTYNDLAFLTTMHQVLSLSIS